MRNILPLSDGLVSRPWARSGLRSRRVADASGAPASTSDHLPARDDKPSSIRLTIATGSSPFRRCRDTAPSPSR